jgi:hypothetical protein
LKSWLDWLDRQNDVVFFVVLYFVRWPVVLSLSALQSIFVRALVGDKAMESFLPSNALVAFLVMVVAYPIIETPLECSLPYWFLKKLDKINAPRPWLFIFVSAALMGFLHCGLPLSLVTGLFLGYCYAHYAGKSQGLALGCTVLFHAAINLTGWVMMFVFDLQL